MSARDRLEQRLRSRLGQAIGDFELIELPLLRTVETAAPALVAAVLGEGLPEGG